MGTDAHASRRHLNVLARAAPLARRPSALRGIVILDGAVPHPMTHASADSAPVFPVAASNRRRKRYRLSEHQPRNRLRLSPPQPVPDYVLEHIANTGARLTAQGAGSDEWEWKVCGCAGSAPRPPLPLPLSPSPSRSPSRPPALSLSSLASYLRAVSSTCAQVRSALCGAARPSVSGRPQLLVQDGLRPDLPPPAVCLPPPAAYPTSSLAVDA